MQSSFFDLEYAVKKLVTRRDRFLAGGGLPINLSRMLCMYMAQQYFGLSDEGMEIELSHLKGAFLSAFRQRARSLGRG